MVSQSSISPSIVEAQLKDIVQNLYNLIVQSLDHQGPQTQLAMKREIHYLVQNLVTVSDTAPKVAIAIPPDVTAYVEGSRNPDIYTREFVEMAQRMNQMLKGRSSAYSSFRDCLARDFAAAIPELKDEVETIARPSGGNVAT